MPITSIRREGSVAVLTLDDGKANAFGPAEFQALRDGLKAVEATDASALVLAGRAGFFSAGLNLKLLPTLEVSALQALVKLFGETVFELFLFPRPVVAAVGGHALGAGAMFALAADVRLAAEGTFKLGLNEVPAGLFVPTFGIELVRAAASPHLWTRMLVHGATFAPAEAHAERLYESLHAPDALLAAAVSRAAALGELHGTGYAYTKQLVRGPHVAVAKANLGEEISRLGASLSGKKA